MPESPDGLVKTQIAGSQSAADSVGLGQGLGICISNRFSCDAHLVLHDLKTNVLDMGTYVYA